MRVVFLAVAACLIASASLVAPIPAAAQQNDDDLDSFAVCMVRTQSDGELLSIILPPAFEDAMEAEGFERLLCSDAFTARSRVLSYRDTVCDLASIQSESVQESYEEKLGERPAVLCALAQASVGEWQRRGAGD